MSIKTVEYKNFSRRINALAYENRLPLRVMFELTYRCNFRCIHCYNATEQKKAPQKEELNTKDVINILRQLKELGCFYIGFTGGEIFLRQDILEIIRRAKKLGFTVILLTNGSFIDEALADEIKQVMPNKVDISVHSTKKDVFEEITRVSGSYAKVFRAIDLLHQRRVPLGFKICGMQQNKNDIKDIRQFAKKLHAIYRFGMELVPRHDRSRIPLEYAISPKEAYAVHKMCYAGLSGGGGKKGRLQSIKLKSRNFKRVFNCGAGYTDLTINPFGELQLCIDITYPRYNVLTGSLAEGWEIIKSFVDKVKPPKAWACKSCVLAQYCSWCPAKGYLNNGTFTSCDPYSREQAQFRKDILSKNGM